MSVLLRRAEVVQEALGWLGTPYHHCADVRGVGVDCAMLLVRVYATCGLVPADLDPRPYAPDWHLHRSDERYLGWLDLYAAEQVSGSPAPADIVVWQFGRCYSHAAIVVGQGAGADIVHAWRPARAVERSTLRSADLVSRPSRRYRCTSLLTS